MESKYVELNASQFRRTVDLIGDVDQAREQADWAAGFVYSFVGFLQGINAGIKLFGLSQLVAVAEKVESVSSTYKMFFDDSDEQMAALQRLVGSSPYRVKGYLEYRIDTYAGTEYYREIKFKITGLKKTVDSPWLELM